MSRRGQALSDDCATAGLEGDFSANVLLPVWEKFLAIVPLSSVNSLTRVPLGVYREDPQLWGLCEASLRETAAVGLAEGIALPPDAVDKVIVQFRSMPPHGMTSMCNDLLRGNRLELPWFAGKVVELGRRHGIPTPVCKPALRRLETAHERQAELSLRWAPLHQTTRAGKGRASRGFAGCGNCRSGFAGGANGSVWSITIRTSLPARRRCTGWAGMSPLRLRVILLALVERVEMHDHRRDLRARRRTPRSAIT
jgi:hypothetical protein